MATMKAMINSKANLAFFAWSGLLGFQSGQHVAFHSFEVVM